MRNLFTLKYLLLFILFASADINAFGQTIIAKWTFEGVVTTNTGTTPTVSTGTSVADVGTQTSGSSFTGFHTSSATVWSNPTGNGSAKSLSSNTWAVNDYYQFVVNTTGYSTISVIFDQTGSSTGPRDFKIQYSVDGTTFNDFTGNTYSIPNNAGAWSATTAQPASTLTFNLSSISVINNVSAVYFRIIDASAVSNSNAAVGTGGTSRVDNFTVTGSSNNANLSNLVLSAGTLIPSFSSSTTSYTASVANSVTSITITPTASDANATIKVNGTTVSSGSASSPISLNTGNNIINTVVTALDGTTTKTYTVTVNRASGSTPTLSQTAAIADFGNVCINTTAGPNSFTIDGSNLDGSSINVASLSGYTYSESSSGLYTSTLSFSYTGNSFTGKVIYVKFTPTAVQSYNGNITVSGGGAANLIVPTTGSGVNSPPSIITGSASIVTATTATISGSISGSSCGAITSYGFEYSNTAGFANGTGTQITSSNLNAGNFSVNLTGLTPNAKYYYKAFAVSGGNTSYGSQQTFTNTPLPVIMASQSGLSYLEDFHDIA
ncbi:MAG: cadherin-like beta sandwich domain-containing protein, partial [Bacteroidota bacterium]|nr:cadherin-like beta sandwich domain-containing protein [Bacteroidota bacterium]